MHGKTLKRGKGCFSWLSARTENLKIGGQKVDVTESSGPNGRTFTSRGEAVVPSRFRRPLSSKDDQKLAQTVRAEKDHTFFLPIHS